ncbi:MAG: hypothetical protein LQ352_006148 [Teloschistes flavicans]|nr:MAG: hypothetical protein LQ352_006148 [Teloschistes flavicans]
MTPISDEFTLRVRQGPERGKVAAVKEKDRKPVDPPPIIQLQIRDPLDPAQNYLQSPYLFMCANLCDAETNAPADLAPQTVLSGTLVSSLHRLKDVDNSDGGFFVFGDLSVKIEGEFRLRFNLFEMLKTEVVFIKSIMSATFTVFSAKVFPGMAESTFLSRSFGDQGVRLRIRKEPRSLCKRPASSLRSDEYSASFEDSSASAQRDMAKHACGRAPNRAGPYPSHYPSLSEPSAKRQRTSVDMSDRPVFDADRLTQRPYVDQRAPYNSFQPAPQVTNAFPPSFSQGSQSALSSVSEVSYGHQRNNSSSASSPFISPHTDGSTQSWGNSNFFYPTTLKDPLFTFPQGQYSQGQYSQGQYSQAPFMEMQPPRPPQASDPSARQRDGLDLSNRAQMNTNFTFPRAQDPDISAAGSYGQLGRSLPVSSNYNDASSRLPSTDDLAASSRQQYPETTLSNVLPPIDPLMTAGQHRGPSQMLPNNIIPSIEPHTMIGSHSVQDRESESYDSNAYSAPLPNHKESDDA